MQLEEEKKSLPVIPVANIKYTHQYENGFPGKPLHMKCQQPASEKSHLWNWWPNYEAALVTEEGD